MALVSIVVPVYHNAASLPDLVARFQELSGRNPDDRFEFVFVDDGSRDNSFSVLEELAAGESRIRIVKLVRNFGSTAALLAGLEQARGDAVAAIAADLQDPPELIDELLTHWRGGRKVVLAARASRDDPGLTGLLADLFYAGFRRFAIASMPRGGFDCFLLDRRVCDLIAQFPENNTYLTGLILWVGFEPAVVYYHRRQRERRYGSSMWNLPRKIKYFADAFVAFSYAPVRAATVLGASLGLAGVAYAVVVVLERLLRDKVVEGWSSLMVVLLVASGAQLMMTGVLGEYLWRNLEQTRRRPRFIVDRVVEPPIQGASASGDSRNSPSRAA
jgi:glycosyltransferase involved in cell wall biosynthesis